MSGNEFSFGFEFTARDGMTPIASGDFTNIATNNAADGVYTINGSTVSIGDIIDLDNANTVFDPAQDIDEGGIKTRFNIGPGTYTDRTLAINTPLLTQLLTDGFTITIDLYANANIAVSMYAADDGFNFQSGGGTSNDGPSHRTKVSDKNFNEVLDDTIYPPLGQSSRLAIVVASDHVSASLNGSPAITVAGPGLDPSMAEIILNLSGSADERMRSFAFYDVVADADLPALSAL